MRRTDPSWLDAQSEPFVSVVMATYNGALYLGQQLDSIAAQTRPPDELIIADDASTDRTAAIAESFARGASFPVRILRQPRNVGILDNFYSAFAQVLGEIVFYCDQDDVWEAGKIARVLEAFAPDTALVTHQSLVVTADLAPAGGIAPGNAAYGRFDFPADASSIHGFGHQMAFRRPVLRVMQRLRPVAEQIAPDGVSYNFDKFIPLCASMVGGLVALADPLVSFRRHDRAVSGAGRPLTARESLNSKVRRVIARDAHEADICLRLMGAALDAGLVPEARAARLSGAFEQRQRVCASHRELLGGAGPGESIRLLWSLARRGGFSNRRALHEAGLAAMALLLRCQASLAATARGLFADAAAR